MKELIRKITNFIEADVQDPGETKDLAVLLRVVTLFGIIYYFCHSVFFAYLGHFILAFISVGAIGLACAAFILTYENNTNLALIITTVGLLCVSICYAINLGMGPSYHTAVFLNILIIYYKKTERMRLKMFLTIGMILLLIAVAGFTDLWPYRVELNDFWSKFILMFNICAHGSFMLGFSYSYGNKFNRSEEKLRRINENLERLANYDPLTSLVNRRHMTEILAEKVYQNNRSGEHFTIAIADIDHFKKINDSYGHDTGDHVLSKVAETMRKYMRYKGTVARWGGEEFLFIFDNQDLDGTAKLLETLRKDIENLQLDYKEHHLSVSITFGVEEYNSRLGIDATIIRADKKLYAGKESGRNKVVSHL
ncbi:MAG: GGDEF domain-containing protein [Lachnospiraceae bacterium]|nr:GGDEF domain-containing protein [Lachnospiraceae bacterium]